MSAEIVGRKVGSIGYGLLGLTWSPTIPPEEQSFAAMRAALSANCNLWDGGDFYGPSPDANSLTLLKRYYTKYPEDADKVILNIKGALHPGLIPDGSPDFVRQSVERCVEMLGGKGKIDMFECARRDPNTPLESTLATLGELVEEGKIGGVALCEVNADTIRAAAKVTKIVAVEVEISFSTEPLYNGIAEACAELNIPIIAYCPVGRGMLSGQIKSFDDIPEKDLRKMLPRFQPPNFKNNMKLVKKLETLAQKKKCTSVQLALAWVMSLSKKKGMPRIIPIPGATTIDHVIENGKASEVKLNEEEMAEIDQILANCEVMGDRYHPAGMKSING